MGWPVAFAGFSSLPSGHAVAVNDGDRQAGEVGGPVGHRRRGRRPAWAAPVRTTVVPAGRLPVAEAAAAEAGLSCGGTVTVALQHGAAVPSRFWAAVAAGEPVAMVTRLPGDGAQATVHRAGRGWTGS